MKKVVALFLASVLCLSMGMVAFAESPKDPVIPETPEKPISMIYGGTALDKDGNKITTYATPVKEEVAEILKDEAKVKDILKEAGYALTGNEAVVVLGAADINLPEGTEMPEGGVNLSLTLASFLGSEDTKDLKDGDILYLLHQKKDGTWEVLEGKVSLKGEMFFVDAHFDSLSPVAIIKVMSDGKTVVLENGKKVAEVNTTTGKVTKTSTVKTSPKTGA